jgi:hypothetical protein
MSLPQVNHESVLPMLEHGSRLDTSQGTALAVADVAGAIEANE